MTYSHNSEHLGDTHLLELLYRTAAGIVSCDPQGNIKLLNAAASRILQEANPGGNPLDVLGLLYEHDPEMRSLLDKPPTLGGIVCQDRRIRILRKGIDDFFLNVTISRIDDTTLLLTLHDATQMENAERAARNALVQQATHQSRLETAGNVLHDIGNAMTGIGTHLAQIIGEPPWPELKQISMLAQLVRENQSAFTSALGARRGGALPEFLRALEETLQRRRDEHVQRTQDMVVAVAHIQEILDIQRRYVSGGASGPRTAVSLSDIVHVVASLVERQVQKQSITLRVVLASMLPTLLADRTQLTQVVLNLVKNAIDALENCPIEKPRRIEITGNVDGSHIVLIVSDTGPGIDPTILSELFRQGRTTKPRGSGIGLASSRLIMEGHGGTLDVRPGISGYGTEAVMRLPIPQATKV